MLDNKLFQSINETADALELANAVIEKDYYVTQVIQNMTMLFQLSNS